MLLRGLDEGYIYTYTYIRLVSTYTVSDIFRVTFHILYFEHFNHHKKVVCDLSIRKHITSKRGNIL